MSYLPKTTKTAIANLDLSYYVKKALESGNLAALDAKTAEKEYRHFLCLVDIKINLGLEEFVVPSKRADEIWHQHILDTQAYSNFCGGIIGQYLHHNPHLEEGSDPFNVAVKYTQNMHQKYGHLGFVDVYLGVNHREVESSKKAAESNSKQQESKSNSSTSPAAAAVGCGSSSSSSSSASSCGTSCGGGCGGGCGG